MPKPNDDSDKDNQPHILVDDVIHNTQEPNKYLSVLPRLQRKNCVIGSKQCCDIMSQIDSKHPEKYAHHMLFMFYLFRNETSYVLMADT